VPDRVDSLDAFRGLTMAAMVVVNNPGTWDAMYWPLEHAEWHGCTPTDLIFPFFLFIVGVSLALSKATLSSPWWKIARRAAVIVGLGLFLAGFPFFNPAKWRIPGILQRIGICYLAAATVFRMVQPPARGDGWRRQAILLASIIAVIVLGYWLLLTRFGDLTPEGNVGARIDRALFGTHLYRSQWDPEGLLSSLPAIATTLIGVMTGLCLRSSTTSTNKWFSMEIWGIAMLWAGQLWNRWLPLNKQLWTGSFVLFTGGAALILFAVCYVVIDVRGVRAWSKPLVILGRNAIALFVLSGLIGKSLLLLNVSRPDGNRESLQWTIYERGFSWMAEPKNASLIYSLAFLAMMYAVCHLMYQRKLFLRA
jgi:predicted acyltransferase